MSYHSPPSLWNLSQREGTAEDQDLFGMYPGGFDSNSVEMNLHAMGGSPEPSLPPNQGLSLPSQPRTDPWVPFSIRDSLSVPTAHYKYGRYRGREASVTTASVVGQDFGQSAGSVHSSHDGGGTFLPADAEAGLEAEFGGMDYNDPSETWNSQRKRTRSATTPELSRSNRSPMSNKPRTVKRPKKGASTDPKISYVCQEIVIKDDGQEGLCDHQPFTIPSDLKKHQDKHRKPHKCPQPNCNKGFTTSSDLERHKWSIHHIPGPRGSNGYQCPMAKCSDTIGKGSGEQKEFARKDNFKQHVTRSHPEVNADEVVKIAENRRYQHLIHLGSEVDLHPNPICSTRPVSEAYFESRTPFQMQYSTYTCNGRQQYLGCGNCIYGPQTCSIGQVSTSLYSQPMGSNIKVNHKQAHPEQSPSSNASAYSYTNPSLASSHTSQSIHDGNESPGRHRIEFKVPLTAAPQRPQHLAPNQTFTQSTRYGNCSAYTRSCPGHRNCSSPIQREHRERLRGQMSGQRMSRSGHNAMLDADQQQPETFPQAHHTSGQHVMFQDVRHSPVTSALGVVSGEYTPSGRYNALSTADQTPQLRSGQERRGSKHGLILCEVPGCEKSFRSNSVLQKHMIRHERLFACTFEGCRTTKRFGSKNDWKRHESKQHKGAIKEQWRCDICVTCFDDLYAFEAHFGDRADAICHKSQIRLDQSRISIEGSGGFWCGFCAKIVPIEQDTLNAEDDRFNHIANHFLPGRQPIRCWRLPYGNHTKIEAEENANLLAAETDRLAESNSTSDSTHAAHGTYSDQEHEEDSEASLDDAEGDFEEEDEITYHSSDATATSRANDQTHHHTPRIPGRYETLVPAVSVNGNFPMNGNNEPQFSGMFRCCACGAYYDMDGMQTRCMGIGYSEECNHTFCEDCPGFQYP